MFLKFLCTILFMCIQFLYAQEINTIVYTKNGAVRGTVESDSKGGEYVSFRVIPYAKPPVGDLRFKISEPADDWEGIRDGNLPLPRCPQNLLGVAVGQEDCLYLNVYTPEVTNSSDSLRPVMFFIHGGAFILGGSEAEVYGPEILITENVVLVTTNYRLGALGFLSLEGGISEFSSNNGLKDQILALKWVQDNIQQFGGDPNQVTIFGESAGAVSTHYLILSPLSKGLFHRAIAHSGNAFASWTVGMNNSAIEFAKLLNIQTDDLEDMVEELRDTSVSDILSAQGSVQFTAAVNFPSMGVPSVEGPGENSVLPRHPRDIMQSGDYNQVPTIFGFNDAEGILYVMGVVTSGEEFVFEPDIFIPYTFDQSKKEEIKETQRDFYWNGDIPETVQECVDIHTDSGFHYSAVRSSREHTAHQRNIFLFEFALDTKLNFFKQSNEITAAIPGAAHTDDLGYIFSPLRTPIPEPGSEEEIARQRVVKLWTNFAKYSNPTPIRDDLLQNQIWLPVTSEKLNHLFIGENLEAKVYSNDRYEFWDQLYEDYDTY